MSSDHDNPRTGRMNPAPWKQWGTDIDDASREQMSAAASIPPAVRGALMPDAHVGYGLPIGGVLATRRAVIPYAVGVDIACRMRLSVFEDNPKSLDQPHTKDRLAKAIESETRFGMGAEFKQPREHDVMDRDWTISPVLRRRRDRAWRQLGTSGSGNHFVEFGLLTIPERDAESDLPIEARHAAFLDLSPGKYLALLSHSGSRGAGAAVCKHYSDIAIDKRAGDIDPRAKHLSWLLLEEAAGKEYWDAMCLMGEYAAANHECIHKAISKKLGSKVLAHVENHHNFAWIETHEIEGKQEEVVVHRKGATPAGSGVLGVIPGSMATPGFVVRGLGSAASLHSASHGAGRVMSRRRARESFRWAHVRGELKERDITLLSAGIDENPRVYKDIHAVMGAQTDLVETLARFDPRLVKMAPEGEKPED